ncbi:MAG TPA: hypothetical protein VM914_02495 [Pyrinomonadaceae bacterium]|jgi:hypothetical protein|nr:hypothetical protein [Pyrinomonadaceae bacterium]
MIDWLTRTIHGWGLTWGQVLFGVLFSVVTFVLSLVVVTFVLVKLPANYFHSSHDRGFLVERHPVLRAVCIFAKNLLGLVLVLAGVIMSLPGVPGQGVLTILLGIMLLDFPGKRALETRIIGRPRVNSAVNALRARFDKPPLMLD